MRLDKFIISGLMVCIGIGAACSSKTEKVENRRTAKPEAAESGDGGFQGGEDATGEPKPKPEVFGNLNFQLAKNSEQVSAEFLANLALVNKTSEDQIVLFGKDGRSWLYGPGEAAPTLLEPAVVVPAGSQLFTLPGGDFWLVKPEELARRKAGTLNQGAVTIERYSTQSFAGARDKMRVLYADSQRIIVHLESHIAVLAVDGGQASLNQFELAKLPVDLNGPVGSAGRMTDGGYWLAVRDQVVLIQPKESVFNWKKLKMPLAGFEDYGQLAFWIDPTVPGPKGDAAMVQGGKVWSFSGAPIAASQN